MQNFKKAFSLVEMKSVSRSEALKGQTMSLARKSETIDGCSRTQVLSKADEVPKTRTQRPQAEYKRVAFSLVEMLMALLVASLLMVALAPVMTKKFNEIVTISGLGERKYDPNLELVVFKDNDDFNIPNLVSRITVYMAGGGGAGGVSRYGKQEFTAPNNTFTVPEGVYKLRVFMVGGGGAGGGGGVGTGTAYAAFPGGTSWLSKDFTTPGEDSWTVPDAYAAPDLDTRCQITGRTGWKYTFNGTEYEVKPHEGASLMITACGAGGGSTSYAATGGGGSGGYIVNRELITNKKIIYIKVSAGGAGSGNGSATGRDAGYGAGGGGGGAYTGAYAGGKGGTYGGNGGQGNMGRNSSNAYTGGDGQGAMDKPSKGGGESSRCGTAVGRAGNGGVFGGGGGAGGGAQSSGCYGIGGGGGGGPTTITTTSGANVSDIIFQVGGGGGAGSNGGGGGGGGYGGGAGGSAYDINNPGEPAEYKSLLIGIGKAKNIAGNCEGGGGYGGVNGSNAASGTGNREGGKITDTKLTSIFPNNTYCSGGDGSSAGPGTQGSDGKQGALRLYYGKKSDDNFLSCIYNQAANGGAGGGGGQAWFGEIDVTPGDTLSITVGAGGAADLSDYAKPGGNGGNTIIVHNKTGGGSVTYKVVGGKGGRYEESVTSLSSARGAGGGIGDSMFNWNTDEISDSEFAALVGGTYGGAGGSVASGAGGGAGGSTIDRHGAVVSGPSGVASKAKGKDATEYGTGGGGGGGLQDSEAGSYPGYGGNGAQGYVYIEWGGTNGGGGTAGEFVKKSINNLDNDDRV